MITIVDYKAGNLTSVKRALDHLGIESQITPDAEVVRQADQIIFPGVGAAGAAMETLQERDLDSALREAYQKGTPIFGICIGCQIILTHSDEEDTPCVGLLSGNCPRFLLQDPTLKIPHMGWNSIQVIRPHFILKDVQQEDEFYFVHSYYPQPADPEQILATSEYEITFPVALGYQNIFATQFHPEKSGKIGLQLLKNFAAWRP